jgi:hypothetical protein
MWCWTTLKLGADRAEPRIYKTKWAQSPLRLGSSVGVSGLCPLNITGCLAKCHQSLRLRFVWCCHRYTALRALAGLPNPRYVLRPYAVQRKAQAFGLAARLAPKPCLAAKVCAVSAAPKPQEHQSGAVAQSSRSAPAHPRSLALAAPRPRRCSPSAPQGGSLYTALRHTFTKSPQLAMRCKPSKSVCTADQQRHLDSTRQGQALRVLRSLDVIVAWWVRKG